jgi:hypothetical protein
MFDMFWSYISLMWDIHFKKANFFYGSQQGEYLWVQGGFYGFVVWEIRALYLQATTAAQKHASVFL